MKKIDNNTKVNLIVISITVLIIIFLTVGYSILSKQLKIQMQITKGEDKSIHITSISDLKIANGGEELYNPKNTANTITTNFMLPSLSSSITYTVTIKNNSNKKMKLNNITNTIISNENMHYELEGLNLNQVFGKNSITTFNITFKYKNDILSIPNDTTAGFVILFDFIEYINENELDYIKTNLILDLRGDTKPNNNKWLDNSISNNDMNIVGDVIHNETEKYYDLSNGHMAYNVPLIPITDDFTLEALVKLKSTSLTTTDEAIVSQVSATTNDPGRFKLNFKYSQGYKLLAFINATEDINTNGTNTTYQYTNVIDYEKPYLIQLVRTGNYLKLYLNGFLISTQNFSSNYKISQGNFNIGYWNTVSDQKFYGKVYAVRLYNKALSYDEIKNNYDMDNSYYFNIIKQEENVKIYAVNNDYVESGEGLSLIADGRLMYKGLNPRNFIKFNNDNTIYRIISFNEDNTMKIVSTQGENFPFDISGTRNNITSTYCTQSSTSTVEDENTYYGCNIWETLDNIKTVGAEGSIIQNSSSNTYLNGGFYNSLNLNIKSKIITHDFPVGEIEDNVLASNIIEKVNKRLWTGKIGLITVDEALLTSTSSCKTGSSVICNNSWLNSLSKELYAIWMMNSFDGNTWDVWTTVKGNTISKRRASRYNQPTGTNTILFYLHPAFYISSNYLVTGNGTQNNPYIIEN